MSAEDITAASSRPPRRNQRSKLSRGSSREGSSRRKFPLRDSQSQSGTKDTKDGWLAQTPGDYKVSPVHLVSISVLLLVLLLQFLVLPALDRSTPSSQPTTTATPSIHKDFPNLPFPAEWISTSNANMSLLKEAQAIADQFAYGPDKVRAAAEEFRKQMDRGLQENGYQLNMIPTYVTGVPKGTEKGTYLAVDLGGTNFRVCSIVLHGDSTFTLQQSKVAIPRELMVEPTTSLQLFTFLAKQIEAFLRVHHADHFEQAMIRVNSGQKVPDKYMFRLGFTFSFPVEQFGINKGHLIRWTKGFNIQDALGKDICALLQDAIDALELPVIVAALVNDTVGTLMARSYTSPGAGGALIGGIFGTGTNGAYLEKLDKITKLTNLSELDRATGEMIVNTEWGSFDNGLTVLPNTVYDEELDKNSVNPGNQMFEKRVSGMFLGELLRLAILGLIKSPSARLFFDTHSRESDIGTTTVINQGSKLYEVWGLDTSFLSIVEADTSEKLVVTRQTIEKELLVSSPSIEDAQAIKVLVHAIGKRSAVLGAIAIGAVVASTGRLQTEDSVDVGLDGSLVEFYPGFEAYMRETLREIPEIGADGEKKIKIGIAKDGSGVGAALIALVSGL